MSAVATAKPRTRHSAQRPRDPVEVARRERSPRAEAGRSPSTLEETIARAWEDLAARGRAECLVCGGPLEAEPAMAALPAYGECGRCGATLA